jgi:uncharacterized protein (TIGR02996 family)
MDDRAALLRAITEQPADHTARLVFADFLDETGAAADAVRAEFIRTQVEAETLHPNSNRAPEVERRAHELFAAHWLDWWAPVCAAVGLPRPYRPAGGVRGWLARNVLASGVEPGDPYAVKPGDPYAAPWAPVRLVIDVPINRPAPLNALSAVRFAGGFPESLAFLGQLTSSAEFLRRWSEVSPLARLELSGVVVRDWRAIDGPHLNGLRALELKFGVSTLLDAIGRSPHLLQLEDLRLVPDRSNGTWGEKQYRALAASLLAERVKRLNVEIAVPTETRALAEVPFRNLAGLDVRFYPHGAQAHEPGQPAVVTGVSELLGCTHLAELEELTLDRTTSAAVWRPEWPRLPRLRRLDLYLPDELAGRPFPAEGLLPALTDLTVQFSRNDWLDALAEWPGIARLRHLCLNRYRVIIPKAVPTLLRLVRELDPDRLETLRISSRVCNAETVYPVLTERFGARVRFG